MGLPNGADCRSCVLWHLQEITARNDGSRLGQCRAHAPAVLVVSSDYRVVTRFPITREDEWCGEHATTD